MTSQTSTVTRTVVTRSWRDIDPKVATAAVLTAVGHLVLLVLFVAGRISAAELAIGTGPSSVAVLGAYLKRSTHADVPALAVQVGAVLEVLAPVIEARVPDAAPAIAIVEDGVEELRRQLAAEPTAPAPTPAVPATAPVPLG